MDHVAIMSSKWKLIEEILAGRKTIESRWYKSRISPWDKIKIRDTVYFKYSGRAVVAKAKVNKVLQFYNLNDEKIQEIYSTYGDEIGLTNAEIDRWVKDKKGKKYCILVFLSKPERIEPFEINKAGFGISCAWLTVEDIGMIKKQD